MSDQQDVMIEDQPLKVLGLFGKRQINMIQFDEDKLSKFYHTLCCTICRNLFDNPVYLRCSHRFCKQCIEKYIRLSQNKSCPNCRGQITTKRDLRVDYQMATLIQFTFGNRKKFCQNMQEIQNAQVQSLVLQKSQSRSSGIVRSKSFVEEEVKSVRKKIKMNDTKQQDYSRNQLSSQMVQHFTNQLQTKQKVNIKNSNLRLKNNVSVQQISVTIQPASKQFQKLDEQKSNVTVKKKRGRKRKQDIQKQLRSQHKSQQNLIEQVQQKQLLEKYVIPSKDQLRNQKDLLQLQLGDDYMFKIMKIPTLDFVFTIKLQKYPNSFLTPFLRCKSIQVSAKMKVAGIYKLFEKLLNAQIKNIKLYTNQDSQMKFLNLQSYGAKTLREINQQIWKCINGVEVFDMKELLSNLEDTMRDSSDRQDKSRLRLFQNFENQKQSKEKIEKKRGRKPKKIQEKQNKQTIKQEQKRIIYYELFFCE